MIRRAPNGLWRGTAFYKDKHGQTVVTLGWGRDRADVARDARYF